MLRVLLILCVTIIIGNFAFSQTETITDEALFNKYYKDVQSFGLPIEASLAERKIEEYINGHARKLGLTPSWQAINSEHDYHSFASNLQIIIPGKKSKAIAIMVPLDMPVTEDLGISHDPFLAPAFLCSLMDQLTKNIPQQTIIIVALAASDGQSPGLGTRFFLDNTTRASLICMIALSFWAPVKTWDLIHGGDGKVSPAWLFKAGLKAADNSGMTVSVDAIQSQMYRMGVGSLGIVAPYLKAGIPAIQLRPHNGSPMIDRAESASILRRAVSNFLESEIFTSADTLSWDANYLFLEFNGHQIISEQTIAIIFLASIIAYLALIFFRRSDRYRYFLSLIRNFLALLIIISACFLVFAIDTLLGQLFLPAFSRDPAYLQRMPWFFLGKTIAGVAMVMGLIRLARPWLPKQSSFFAAAAFFTSLAALVIVATISLTVSIYLMASTFFVCLVNLSRIRFLKIMFFVAGFMCIAIPVTEALVLFPGMELDNLLLRSIFPGTIILLLISLPFVFLWCRILLLMPVHRLLMHRFESIVVMGLLIGGFLLMIITLIFVRLNASGFADVVLTREYNRASGEDYLVAEGVSLLPPGTLYYHGQSFHLPFSVATARFKLNSELSDEPVFDQSIQSFLGRKTMLLRISSKDGINNLNLHFTADRELIVHSLNFPYRYLDARNIQVQIGKNLPPVVPLEMTIPLDSSGILSFEADLPDKAEFRADSGSVHELPCTVHFQTAVPWN